MTVPFLAECGNIPGCWKSLFQRHLSTYNYGEGDFFHDRPWQNLSWGDLRISNDGQDNQLPRDDLISLLCGIVSFCTDRELTRSTSPIVFHQSTIPRGLRVCVVKRKRWFNSCFSYYPKSDVSFNIMELCIILSGNIHPLPVQDNETRKTIYRHKKINVVTRGHNKSNWTSVPLLCVQSSTHGKPLFLWNLHSVVLARIIFELDTAVDNYGSLTLRRSNTANEPCVVAIQWKLVLLKIRRRKWFKCRVNFYSNSDATFNVMELCIERSGDVHPMPGPNDNSTSEITLRISSRYRGYNNGNLRLRGTSLYNRNMTNLTMIQRLVLFT